MRNCRQKFKNNGSWFLADVLHAVLIGCWYQNVVCLMSVCLVMLCTVAKLYK